VKSDLIEANAAFDPASGKLPPADNCGVEKSGDRRLRDPRAGETAKDFRAQSSRASDQLKASWGNPTAEIVLSKRVGWKPVVPLSHK
jgi:hypothetical protein